MNLKIKIALSLIVANSLLLAQDSKVFELKPIIIEKAPVEIVIVKNLDSDNDGILDSDDKCPNTPNGVSVDSIGCAVDSDKDGIADYQDKCPNTPFGVEVSKEGCPLDEDGDGVFDYLDKCLDTPLAHAVTEEGCEPDDDKDGIANYLDECKGTPDGFKVDSKGCELTANLKVLFDRGSSKIAKTHEQLIKNFAIFLLDNLRFDVEIIGHTDDVGSSKNNQRLSELRAHSVKQMLIRSGVAEDRLISSGKGESDPIATNLLESGREQNRRIEVKLTH